MLRMANPDLWHPYRGGEKPMDFAYLNAVLRSSYMPPYDPWFGGGYINYYYWGQFIVATLIRATGIEPGIAFNLAVPLFFALTASLAYSVVYNLAEGTRRRMAFFNIGRLGLSERPTPSPTLPHSGGESLNPSPLAGEGRGEGDRLQENESATLQTITPSEADVLTPSPSMGEGGDEGDSSQIIQQTLDSNPSTFNWSPVLAGIAAALFVTVLGNLDGAIQVSEGIWRAMFQNAPFGEFDFWRSSRMMPPDPPGNEITEFPFFTFLFADPHAHLMALPFTVLAVGVSLSVVLGALHDSGRKSHWDAGQLARLVILGVVVGSLRVINTWDYPTYLMVGGAAILIGEFFAHGGISLVMLFRAGVKSIIVFAVGVIAFLPFQLGYETFFNSVESTTNTTVLWQFLAITGLFIFIIGSFFVHESRDLLRKLLRLIVNRIDWMIQAISRDDASAENNPRLSPSPLVRGTTGGQTSPGISVTMTLALIIGALLVGYILTAIFSGAIGSTIPFLAVLLVLAIMAVIRWMAGTRPDAPFLLFAAMLVGIALSLAIGLDVFRVEGDIDRMNSIFKFYLQVWVLLALASAYLLWHLARGVRLPLVELSWPRRVWAAALVILIVSASAYPVFGTQDRLRDRFEGRVTPLTLNGEAYVQDTVYRDREGFIDLDTDFEGIQWLRNNVQGSPIVLEGVTPTYRWGGRVSIYTGLPTVVGWLWHQEQQRWGYREAVGSRIRDVERIYETTSTDEATGLLKEYGVSYIYVGQLEKLYYEAEGLAKFDTTLDGYIEKVYENEDVAIYRVIGGDL
jgi:YYY domain-containing protein